MALKFLGFFRFRFFSFEFCRLCFPRQFLDLPFRNPNRESSVFVHQSLRAETFHYFLLSRYVHRCAQKKICDRKINYNVIIGLFYVRQLLLKENNPIQIGSGQVGPTHPDPKVCQNHLENYVTVLTLGAHTGQQKRVTKGSSINDVTQISVHFTSPFQFSRLIVQKYINFRHKIFDPSP